MKLISITAEDYDEKFIDMIGQICKIFELEFEIFTINSEHLSVIFENHQEELEEKDAIIEDLYKELDEKNNNL